MVLDFMGKEAESWRCCGERDTRYRTQVLPAPAGPQQEPGAGTQFHPTPKGPATSAPVREEGPEARDEDVPKAGTRSVPKPGTRRLPWHRRGAQRPRNRHTDDLAGARQEENFGFNL